MHGNALLALLSAGFWGGGDFLGGMGVKRAGGSVSAALRVILISHAVSLCVLMGFAAWEGDPFPHGAPLYWGLAAGVSAGASLVAFYVALNRGAMGIPAALSGLLAAALPAVVSIWTDGRPSAKHVCGFLIAGVAIWLIAAGGDEEGSAGTIWLAAIAGAGFGVYFIALKFAGEAGVVWPMANSRMGSLTICTLITLALAIFSKRQEQVTINRGVLLWALATAVLDTTGNLMFVAASRAGRLDVAAVLASLYPALTILLAAWTLKERPTRRQGLGMAVAAGAVVLITL
ncbi:DMT family transporter [Granulicella rosea]|nr:DMT family transporter [Granulicella rosea]